MKNIYFKYKYHVSCIVNEIPIFPEGNLLFSQDSLMVRSFISKLVDKWDLFYSIKSNHIT